MDGVLRLGKAGARVISEQSEADLASLIGAVGSNVVGDAPVAVVSIGVTIAVVVVLEVAAIAELRARHVAGHIVAVSVGVLCRLHGRVIRTHVSLHVDDVVSVVGAAAAEVAGALARGAQAEAYEALGHDANIAFVRGFFVPLLHVVASLELNAVAGEEAGVHIAEVVLLVPVLIVVLIVVDTTSVVHQVATGCGVSGNITIVLVDNSAFNGGHEGQSDDSDAREHGLEMKIDDRDVDLKI